MLHIRDSNPLLVRGQERVLVLESVPQAQRSAAQVEVPQHVDEGVVAYFGPLTGGAVAMREMSELLLDPTGKPPHWVLSQPGQADLHIPLNAAGAENLFDAFASLPGIRTEFMLSQIKALPDQPVVIWRRATDLRKLH